MSCPHQAETGVGVNSNDYKGDLQKMKKRNIWLLTALLSIALALSACGGSGSEKPADTVVTEAAEAPAIKGLNEPRSETPEEDAAQTRAQLPGTAFSVSDVEAYTGQAYVVVNDNKPYFSEEDLTTDSFESYSDLDHLGRCGVAWACIGTDLMPTEARESIRQIRPSGWINVEYDHVDGGYLYNRCHLIGFQLAGENANEKNLITGTRYMNVDGMLPFENMVADYVKETDHHVMYRVTPVFEGDNLVASGVLMEAQSVEDQGEEIEFCVYAYNVQPGVTIDYATGESRLAEKDPQPQGADYILNTNTKKFHRPDCGGVEQMDESNRLPYTGSRDELLAQGYAPCGRCNP